MATDPKPLEKATVEVDEQPQTMGRFNKWDTPWLNPKMIGGVAILLLLFLSAVVGPRFWDTDLGFARSAPRNLPPVGFVNWRGEPGVPEHPLGTDNLGRDLLAVAILGAPTTFIIGAMAATLGIVIGIVLGFSAGFLGGWVDDVVRLISDVTLTIPALMVLIVLQSVLDRVEIGTMALLIAAFSWPRATRQIRAQVLSMRESGYVQMARLSGASNFDLMFREMLPNLIPYIFASFIAGATGAILTAVGLETLGLGPTRVSTLGGTIYDAYVGTALSLNMWWWWGLPTVLLSIMFIGLLLINLGFDEISNPRLRKASK
jgi:peptide/nickel transport system permease protein